MTFFEFLKATSYSTVAVNVHIPYTLVKRIASELTCIECGLYLQTFGFKKRKSNSGRAWHAMLVARKNQLGFMAFLSFSLLKQLATTGKRNSKKGLVSTAWVVR